MDEEGITIMDRNYREPIDEKLAKELKEHEDENLRRAEEKENAMLDASWQRSLKRAEKRRKFIDGIKKVFSRKSTEIQKQQPQAQR